MKKWLAVVTCIFCLNLLFAQQSRVLLQVVDSATLEPLARVTVQAGKEDPITVFTNDSGEVWLYFDKGESRKQVRLSMVGYRSFELPVKQHSGNIRVRLIPRAVSLLEAEVFPDLPAHLFFGSKETQVLDYVATPFYTLVALYNYYRKHCYLVLLDAHLQVTDEQPVPADFEKFHISGLGYIYALTPSRVFEITIKKGLLQTKNVTQARFYKTIQYYCGGHQQYLYLTQRAKTGQSVIFFHEDTENKVIYNYNPFCIITNDARQRNAIWDMRKPDASIRNRDMVSRDDLFPNYHPSEGDIIPGGFRSDKEFFSTSDMLKRYGEHPVYTPFFNTNGGLMVFDFYKNTVNRYQYNTEPLSVDSITFHNINGWMPLVLKNEDDQLFTVYKDSSQAATVHLINTASFSTRPLLTLAHKGITNINISGEYVYYMLQPYPNKNNVFLFREQLTK